MMTRHNRLPGSTHAVFVLATALGAGLLLSPRSALAGNNSLTDGNIHNALENEILFDHAVMLDDIDVIVDQGIVTLSGEVSNKLAKDRAVRLAETVRGVRSIVDQIKVKQPENISRAELQKNISDALLMDPATDSYEVTVKADDKGVVTLDGQVQSWQERLLTEKVASGVRGVIEVQNNLALDYKTTRPEAALTPEIKQALHWNVLVDDSLIDVEVNDGNVKLSGSVGSMAEKREARTCAWVGGVMSVNDDALKIVDWADNDMKRPPRKVAASDEELRKAINDAMLYDPRVNMFNVTPEVSNGIVTLRGKVDNLKAKRAAGEDARNTLGVIYVKNRIKVRSESTLSDAEIARRIKNSLKRDPYIDRYDVTVSVVDGVAYLSGEVDSRFDRGQADDIASKTEGVKRVINRLSVDYIDAPLTYDPYVYDWYVYDYPWYDATTFTYQTKSDMQICNDIESELWWSPFVDSDDVAVDVDDGIATLTGTVDSWSESRSATENAYEGGAIRVNNELRIQ